jgi:hypothetical protein
MSPRKQWKASSNREQKKLAGHDDGNWKLAGIGNSRTSAGTRTHHGGEGRPNLVKDEQLSSSCSDSESSPSLSSEDINWSYHQSDDTDPSVSSCSDKDATSDDSLGESSKPPATRVIVDVEGLKSTLEHNSYCMQCHGRVSAILRTTCIATSIMVKCKKPECAFIYYSTPPAEIDIEDDTADHRERSTDYAINILYVLGFISYGDGGTEAARILGLLGLPNDTTMQSRSFAIIEDRISSKVQDLTRDLLRENLIEEVRRSTRCANDFDLWNNQSLAAISLRPYSTSPSTVESHVPCSFDI